MTRRKPVKKKSPKEALKSLKETQRKGEEYIKEQIASGRVKVTPDLIERFKNAKPPRRELFTPSKPVRKHVKESKKTHTGIVKQNSSIRVGGGLGKDVVKARIKETHPSGERTETELIRVDGKLAVSSVRKKKKKKH